MRRALVHQGLGDGHAVSGDGVSQAGTAARGARCFIERLTGPRRGGLEAKRAQPVAQRRIEAADGPNIQFGHVTAGQLFIEQMQAQQDA